MKHMNYDHDYRVTVRLPASSLVVFALITAILATILVALVVLPSTPKSIPAPATIEVSDDDDGPFIPPNPPPAPPITPFKAKPRG